ncbi:PH domain-containing protein [Actinokineospora sp.]|uniref:PH domain-containing protein n=1 Tax=Actinokineospora sp. TaxID=1872133 RepID=UPI00403818D3
MSNTFPALGTAAPDEQQLVLRKPRHRVERRAILWWTLRVALWTVATLGGLGFLYGQFESTRPWLGPLWIALAATFAVNLVAMPVWRYYVHRWETTGDAVYSLKGWLVHEWRIIPISRVQSVDVIRGPLQQLLGLATVQVITAAKEGQIKIDGLDYAVAAETAAMLTDIAKLTPGDAT